MYFELILKFYLVENNDNIKQRKFSLLCPIFSDMRMFIFGLAFVLNVLRLSRSSVDKNPINPF